MNQNSFINKISWINDYLNTILNKHFYYYIIFLIIVFIIMFLKNYFNFMTHEPRPANPDPKPPTAIICKSRNFVPSHPLLWEYFINYINFNLKIKFEQDWVLILKVIRIFKKILLNNYVQSIIITFLLVCNSYFKKKIKLKKYK